MTGRNKRFAACLYVCIVSRRIWVPAACGYLELQIAAVSLPVDEHSKESFVLWLVPVGERNDVATSVAVPFVIASHLKVVVRLHDLFESMKSFHRIDIDPHSDAGKRLHFHKAHFCLHQKLLLRI